MHSTMDVQNVHIDIKYHFIREHVASAAVNLEYCSTEEMIADIFTKGLSAVQFTKLRKIRNLYAR